MQNGHFHESYFLKTFTGKQALPESKVAHFAVIVGFAPFPFDEDERERATQDLYNEFFSVFDTAGLRKNAIQLASKVNKLKHYMVSPPDPEERQKAPWFIMRYTEPGFGFSISMSDIEFKISAENIRLANLVDLASTVFQGILNTVTRAPIADLMRVFERAMSVDYYFRTEYRVETDRVQIVPPKNYEIIHRALRLERKVPDLDLT